MKQVTKTIRTINVSAKWLTGLLMGTIMVFSSCGGSDEQPVASKLACNISKITYEGGTEVNFLYEKSLLKSAKVNYTNGSGKKVTDEYTLNYTHGVPSSVVSKSDNDTSTYSLTYEGTNLVKYSISYTDIVEGKEVEINSETKIAYTNDSITVKRYENNVIDYSDVYLLSNENLTKSIGVNRTTEYSHEDKLNPLRGNILFFFINGGGYEMLFNKNNMARFTTSNKDGGVEEKNHLYLSI